MDTRFSHSPAEVAKVRMVQFGILSADEIVILFFIFLFEVLLTLGFCSISVELRIVPVLKFLEFGCLIAEANVCGAY